MLQTNRNFIREALRQKRPVSAAWLQAASPITAEILAQAGFDVLLVDREHAPGDFVTLINQIQAMKGEPAVPFVRASHNDPVEIKRILDSGAYGVVVPHVSTRLEAEQAVAATRYPPRGNRGLAGSPRATRFGDDPLAYFKSIHDDVCILIQIETPGGVENLRSILETEDLDGVFIGPQDLATTHGHLGNPDAPEIIAILRSIEKTVLESGKCMATICSDFADAKAKYERGYQMIALMHDTVTLGKIARQEVSRFRNEILNVRTS